MVIVMREKIVFCSFALVWQSCFGSLTCEYCKEHAYRLSDLACNKFPKCEHQCEVLKTFKKLKGLSKEEKKQIDYMIEKYRSSKLCTNSNSKRAATEVSVTGNKKRRTK